VYEATPRRCARADRRKNACNLTLMTRQAFFNLRVLALLALLAFNTASIARSLRRIEQIDRHRHVRTRPVAWYLLSAPILLQDIATPSRARHRGATVAMDKNNGFLHRGRMQTSTLNSARG